MKKLSTILILLISLFVNYNLTPAEEPIKTLDDFLGIQWGASPEIVSQTMTKRGASQINTLANGDIIIYSDTFIGKDAQIGFYFYNNQMWQTMVMINSPEYAVIDNWKDTCSLIEEKYGKPSDDFYFFKTPYRKGDGFETQAISMGKGTAAKYWFFKNPNGKEDNALVCEISTSLQIHIVYQNGDLTKESIAAQKAKKSNDL